MRYSAQGRHNTAACGRIGASREVQVDPFRLRSPTGCALMHFWETAPMRVLAILALALLLAGCEGDRIKHGSMNERQAQPQSTVLT
jgi:hypothetical protein